MDEKIQHLLLYFVSIGGFILIVGAIMGGVSDFEFNRQFYEQDPRLSNHHQLSDTVSNTELFLICILIPFFFSFVVVLAFPSAKEPVFSWKDRGLELFALLCSYTVANCVTAFIQSTCITLFDEPRPNMFFLCNYQGFRDAVDSGNFTNYLAITDPNRLGNTDNCWDQDQVPAVMQAFFSGHASFSFCSMFWLVLVLIHYTKVFPVMKYLQFLNWLPLIISGWISYSRVYDYMHSELDITVAALIGMFSSYYFFEDFLYFFGKKGNEGSGDKEKEILIP
jgi:membrane-associated phospholipid phosphatase